MLYFPRVLCAFGITCTFGICLWLRTVPFTSASLLPSTALAHGRYCMNELEVLNQCCSGYMDSEIECRWCRNSRCFLKKQGDLIYLFGTACNTGDPGSIPGSGRFPWRRKWQPTQYFRLENPKDRGAWGATVHQITKS